MQHPLETSQPFSFSQTLAFVRRFPALKDECIVADDSLTAAVAIDGRAVPFTVRARGNQVIVETPNELAVPVAARFIGAHDDVAGLYARASGDAPFQAVIEGLRGLHHVRFLTLGEIAVYSVMMQRATIGNAAALKRKFLARFGIEVVVQGKTLRAMPELARLVELDGEVVAEAIGHRPKAERIVQVVRGVAALGEAWLRESPYQEARDALLELPGVGPFSAGAILLRGLGRMDELPSHRNFEQAGRAIYGRRFDAAAITASYGQQIGYWAFYVMAAAGRSAMAPSKRSTSAVAPRASGSRRAA